MSIIKGNYIMTRKGDKWSVFKRENNIRLGSDLSKKEAEAMIQRMSRAA